jgi:hypothetical protein
LLARPPYVSGGSLGHPVQLMIADYDLGPRTQGAEQVVVRMHESCTDVSGFGTEADVLGLEGAPIGANGVMAAQLEVICG